MDSLPLLRAEDSVLLLIDLQTRLASSMPSDGWVRARDSAILLAEAAGELGLPVIATLQYPKGLGALDPDIEAALPAHAERIEKTCFSACAADGFAETLDMCGRRQMVVCGMETHVCVVQTVAGLAADGYAPFVVADGVCSRDPAHADNALARMRAAGVPVVNRESALFEWLRDARHERFKALSKRLK